MISQSELVERFYNGETSGNASNMSIGTTYEDGVFVIGYGHAIYAYRPPDDRFGPVVFTGWKGASKSTNQHISLLEGKAEHTSDGRPGESDVAGDPDLDKLKAISGNDKDYSKPHNQRERGRGD